MSKIRKISAVLGIKGLLAVASLTSIAIALVVYSTAVTITPANQFTMGPATYSWNVYINDQNAVRYLPGDTAPPSTGSTYAFSLNDLGTDCAVQIQLTSAMSSGLFSNFDITVMYYDTTLGWTTAQLYDSAIGGSTLTSINGLNTTPGFIRQAAGAGATSYLIRVTYSYDIVGATTPVTATFQYTPLPL
ncbi:hypothetical protein E2P61_06545 [Candidatus Bathyarchaeota archaeon]|nr:hypothetical protein E2P61_06545 [Candidatus Bathyarchaeota archaeon]